MHHSCFAAGSQKRMEEIEDELIVVLKEINADMDK